MPSRVSVLPGLHRIEVTSGRRAPQTLAGTAHTATRVIGFSQTREWFLSGFETHVVDAHWEAVTPNGASIEKWADSTYVGWSTAAMSTVAQGPITRAVLNVSGAARSQAQWQADIEAAVTTLQAKLPDVTAIILEPVVGGPAHTVCQFAGQDVRAAANHPTIDLAIADAVAANPSLLSAGLSPEVGDCSHYEDTTGHLSSAGAAHVAAQMGAYYAGLG